MFHQFLKNRDQIDKISLTESRILLNGPSGSGKELIARKIHKNSKRKNRPFIILNGAFEKQNNRPVKKHMINEMQHLKNCKNTCQSNRNEVQKM